MRLNCNVEIQNWSSGSQSVGGQRKPVKASLSVGRKSCNNITQIQNNAQWTAFLLLSTAKNMSGSKYKITGNISQVFAKFLANGKATIRFKEPSHDLCLSKADPSMLRSFLSTLRLSLKDSNQLKLPVLTAPKQIETPKTELFILKKSDYPTSSSFPDTLEKLRVSHCGMVRFDVRILKLKHLVSLDLSNNRIKELDVSLDRLKSLKRLNFSSNEVKLFPSKFCRSSLATSLTCLDLSHNNLSCLPYALGTMVSLVTLKLNNNVLCTLPASVGQITNLCSLLVAENQLRILPYTVRNLQLDCLDVAGNPFLDNDSWYKIDQPKLPSLQEWAARAIKNSRTYYNAHMIGRCLCDFLDSAKICVNCNSSSFESVVHDLWPGDLCQIAHTVYSTGNTLVPFEVWFCSQACHTNWKNQAVRME